MARTYSVICQSVYASPDGPWGVTYGIDPGRFATRKQAIKHGFRLDRSDDFNVGVWEGDRLVSLDWMNEPVETDADLLLQIQQHGMVDCDG